jgi:hypothetical protein
MKASQSLEMSGTTSAVTQSYPTRPKSSAAAFFDDLEAGLRVRHF